MAEPRPISSRDNPLLQRIRKLAADPGGYRKLGEVWIEGDHLCAAFAQRGGRALQAVLTRDGWHDPALRALADSAAASVIVTPELMAGLSTLESPPRIGFVVVAPTAPRAGAGPAFGGARPLAGRRQRRRDPAQRGGVRVRAGAGAEGHGGPVVAQGAACRHGRALRAAPGRRAAGRSAGRAGGAAAGDQFACSAGASRGAAAVAVCVGDGPRGARHLGGAACSCQRELRIPQPGGEESLNVAAAAAVCLYESARQRAPQS